MKPPRDISGQELAAKLTVFGYGITRQNGEHYITFLGIIFLRLGRFQA